MRQPSATLALFPISVQFRIFVFSRSVMRKCAHIWACAWHVVCVYAPSFKCIASYMGECIIYEKCVRPFFSSNSDMFMINKTVVRMCVAVETHLRGSLLFLLMCYVEYSHGNSSSRSCTTNSILMEWQSFYDSWSTHSTHTTTPMETPLYLATRRFYIHTYSMYYKSVPFRKMIALQWSALQCNL